jgi:hypothetical protein
MGRLSPIHGRMRRVPHDIAWVLRRRLATQRLSSAPLGAAQEVVRRLGCVQAQDATMGLWALGVRLRRPSQDAVLAEQRTGSFVRTHILRPTWHFVAAEDLRWMLATTSPKVEARMAARHRQLGLDGPATSAGLDALGRVLAGAALTRMQIGALGHDRLPAGEVLGHLLMLAELRGLVCSGPPSGAEHTYALVDEVVPAGPDDHPTREDGVRRLTERFFTGHGPATERDLARWCGFTLVEIRAAVRDLVADHRLASVELDGDTFWFDPARPPRATAATPVVRLLWIYDEAVLTYQLHGLRRVGGGGWRADAMATVSGGVVLVDDRDVGVWQRRLAGDEVAVRVRLDEALTGDERAALEAEASRYAGFVGRPLDLHVT